MILRILIFIVFIPIIASAEIRLGGLFSSSGAAGYIGTPERDTLIMLVDEVNRNGGINGRQIKLFIYDTHGDETRAITQYKRLATKDKVLAIIGPSRTGTTLAIKRLSSKYKVPVISCATSALITTAPNDYMFKTAQSDSHGAEKIFSYMQLKGMKNVALLTDQTGYGSTGRDALIKLAPSMGISIIADERFSDTDKDITSQIYAISKKNVDATIVWGVGPAVAIASRNAKQLGLKNLFMSQGVASKKFIELAGDAAEGIILPAGRLMIAELLNDNDSYKPTLINYKKDFEKRYKYPVSAFGGHAYDGFMLFKTSYKNGGTTPIKMKEKLEEVTKAIGIAGEFNLSKDEHCGLSKEAFIMVGVKGGEFVVVE